MKISAQSFKGNKDGFLIYGISVTDFVKSFKFLGKRSGSKQICSELKKMNDTFENEKTCFDSSSDIFCS